MVALRYSTGPMRLEPLTEPQINDIRKMVAEWRASHEMSVDFITRCVAKRENMMEDVTREGLSAIRVLKRKGKLSGRLTPDKIRKAGLRLSWFYGDSIGPTIGLQNREGLIFKFYKK